MARHGAPPNSRVRRRQSNIAGNRSLEWIYSPRFTARAAIALFVLGAHTVLIVLVFQWTPRYSSNQSSEPLVIVAKFIASAGLETSSSETPSQTPNRSTIENSLPTVEPTPNTKQNSPPLLRSYSDAADHPHFHDNEVDLPATPVGDWVINPTPLPIDRPSRLAIKIWVSAEGSIERWELIAEDAPAGADIVLQDLNRTVMNAARIGGKRVASIRFIELVVDRTDFELGMR